MSVLLSIIIALLTSLGIKPPELVHCAKVRAEVIPETKDRLPPERMEELVRAPMGKVRSGDLDAGRLSFERLLARSPQEQEGDLLTSFGILLYVAGLDRNDDELRRASLPYLERAVPALERRFGPVHPEVALALNSLADAQWDLAGEEPPASVEAALERALDIRRRTLGPRNLETVATAESLARLKAQPSRTRGQPARIAEAEALYRTAIADADAMGPAGAETAYFARIELAELYRDQGLAGRARSVREEAERKLESTSRCGPM